MAPILARASNPFPNQRAFRYKLGTTKQPHWAI
jgi:hypothetical protein